MQVRLCRLRDLSFCCSVKQEQRILWHNKRENNKAIPDQMKAVQNCFSAETRSKTAVSGVDIRYLLRDRTGNVIHRTKDKSCEAKAPAGTL